MRRRVGRAGVVALLALLVLAPATRVAAQEPTPAPSSGGAGEGWVQQLGSFLLGNVEGAIGRVFETLVIAIAGALLNIVSAGAGPIFDSATRLPTPAVAALANLPPAQARVFGQDVMIQLRPVFVVFQNLSILLAVALLSVYGLAWTTTASLASNQASAIGGLLRDGGLLLVASFAAWFNLPLFHQVAWLMNSVADAIQLALGWPGATALLETSLQAARAAGGGGSEAVPIASGLASALLQLAVAIGLVSTVVLLGLAVVAKLLFWILVVLTAPLALIAYANPLTRRYFQSWLDLAVKVALLVPTNALLLGLTSQIVTLTKAGAGA